MTRCVVRGAGRRGGPWLWWVLLLALFVLGPRPALAQAAAAYAAAGGASAPAAIDPSAAALARGQTLYRARCYFCHGYGGDARTQAAQALAVPPRDFTAPPALTRPQILAALRQGRPGTAMASFASLLDEGEMADLADYLLASFVRPGTTDRPNDRPAALRYHSAENGWGRPPRDAQADRFAQGELAVDDPGLGAAEQAGLARFLAACSSCHAPRSREALGWSAQASSYPRPGILPGGELVTPPGLVTGPVTGPGAVTGPRRIQIGPGAPSAAASAVRPATAASATGSSPAAASGVPPLDAWSSASIYARHDQPPRLAGLTAQARRGGRLFQQHCAFCHAADGSGQHWIGRFLDPPARDLRRIDAATRARLPEVIRSGLPGRSMPAWRGVLQEAEIQAVAAYVRRLAEAAPGR